MSPTESSSAPLPAVASAAASSVGLRLGEAVGPDDGDLSTATHALSTATHTLSARAFLIQLVSREIQLGHRRAGWLRTVSRHLAGAGQAELAAECVRLAADSWKQREQLVVLLHRLVARWNRGIRRRIEPLDLTEQPASKAVLDYIDVNEHAVGGATPTAVLAGIAAVERMLCEAVCLGLELVDCEDGDVDDARQLFHARAARAAAFDALVDALQADAPSQTFTRFAAQAIESFTIVTRENAELGRQLVNWRSR